MQFLADESCDAIMVRALRAQGWDVSVVADTIAGAPDDQVLQTAVDEERVLITQDRDFCALVFRDGKPHAGIVLVRIPDNRRAEKAQRIIDLVDQAADRLSGAMTTLTLTSIRIRSFDDTESESQSDTDDTTQ
jgi:predicted nuclease of predicted toxin-antitoxin system